MPFSYDDFKPEIGALLRARWNESPRPILDVGPGIGTYATLLDPIPLDAVEVFPNYVDDYKLREKYGMVIIADVREIDLSPWRAIILGDVLEHLTAEEGVKLISKITEQGQECLVAVPYLNNQGAWYANTYETHLQPDLTPEVMAERYPQLRPVFTNERYGYYVNWDYV